MVATGNESAQDPSDSLASVNGTVGVGASDSAGRIQSYSNYGKGLTVLAPGDLDYHDLGNGGQVVSTSGTSAATPIVAGFVAVADVLRPEAPRAIRAALKAGVSVRMITGDHFETAYQIGRELGMVESRDEVFDCRDMAKLSDDQLDAIVTKTKVFSRVIPEQKYRLLTILKKHHITAMTGDCLLYTSDAADE